MEEISNRYASALVSIAKDEGKLEQYKIAIFSLANLFEEDKTILHYLKSYFVKFNEKSVMIDELCKEFSLENLSNFLKLLTEKHHIGNFKEIAKEITKEINNELNIFEGIVYSTEPLSESRINEIEDAISKKLNRKVELANKIDSRLIGGVKVVVHDHVFDGSIKAKLENMKQNLKERRTTNEN